VGGRWWASRANYYRGSSWKCIISIHFCLPIHIPNRIPCGLWHMTSRHTPGMSASHESCEGYDCHRGPQAVIISISGFVEGAAVALVTRPSTSTEFLPIHPSIGGPIGYCTFLDSRLGIQPLSGIHELSEGPIRPAHIFSLVYWLSYVTMRVCGTCALVMRTSMTAFDDALEKARKNKIPEGAPGKDATPTPEEKPKRKRGRPRKKKAEPKSEAAPGARQPFSRRGSDRVPRRAAVQQRRMQPWHKRPMRPRPGARPNPKMSLP
jgi:hypothetical protein